MVVLEGQEYLTVSEASRRLGVKPATLYASVSRGVLQSYRQGIKRHRLYRRTEIESLLQLAPGVPRSRAVAIRVPTRFKRRADIPLAESWIRE